MKIETRHRVYNPTPMYPYPSTLAAICSDMETEGWELTRIIPHNQFEAVAVFQRLIIEPKDRPEETPTPEPEGDGYL